MSDLRAARDRLGFIRWTQSSRDAVTDYLTPVSRMALGGSTHNTSIAGFGGGRLT